MGRFSPKFTDAVRLAAGSLRGSIYARYYRIDYDDVLERLTMRTLAATRADPMLLHSFALHARASHLARTVRPSMVRSSNSS